MSGEGSMLMPHRLDALMTFHGSFLKVDSDGAIRQHAPLCLLRDIEKSYLALLDVTNGSRVKHELVTTIFASKSEDVREKDNIFSNFIALKIDNIFLTAEPDGRVTKHAKAIKEWETLLAIPREDLLLLRHILRSSWILDGSAEVVRPRDIRLQPPFMLLFGSKAISLAVGSTAMAQIFRPDRIDCDMTVPEGGVHARRVVALNQLPPPQIWIKPLGNTANRALQYLVSNKIKQFVPNAVIMNVCLPEWGIESRCEQPPLLGASRLGWSRFWIDVPGLGDCLRRGVIDTLVLDSFSFNIDHYPARSACKLLLGPTLGAGGATGFKTTELVCSIRGGEVLRNAHPDYLVLPPAYYRLLQKVSGLDLVFFGQIGDDPYTNALRDAFPEAQFILGKSPEYDFEMIRRSANIALSVSTFAWLAGWLSEANTIYLPVGGMFNPNQHKSQLHLPINDSSYRFVLLPFSNAVDVFSEPEEFWAQQDLLSKGARMVEVEELKIIIERAKTHWRPQPLVRAFDPSFYVAKYPEIAKRLREELPSALEHYIHNGFYENRLPCDFHSAFYVRSYPEAAIEVAKGYYASPLQHYLEVGWERGYQPTPN